MGLTAPNSPVHAPTDRNNHYVPYNSMGHDSNITDGSHLPPRPSLPSSFTSSHKSDKSSSFGNGCWPRCFRRHSAPEQSKAKMGMHLGRSPSGKPNRPASTNMNHSHVCFFMEEDNARFFLLAFLLQVYLILGAGMFQALEETSEKLERNKDSFIINQDIEDVKAALIAHNCSWNNIESLMYSWGNATKAGLTSKPSWDYSGSFQFVYTVVSTIGYGATSPRTVQGKLFCVVYGLLGCSSCILFFNLFLERIITFMAYCMRQRHLQKQRARRRSMQAKKAREASQTKPPQPLANGGSQDKFKGSQESVNTPDGRGKGPDHHHHVHNDDEDSEEDSWKPSVYRVLLYLSLISLMIGVVSSVVFGQMEEWNYVDSFYFCFISFATIGFGDLVATQQDSSFYGAGVYAYRFFNFTILVVGCCCIYSLFNVISITIKQLLNWMIKQIAILYSRGYKCMNREVAPPTSITQALFAASIQRGMFNSAALGDVYGSEMERKLSGEVTMKEFISSNKVSLAVMQKQLHDAQQRNQAQDHHGGGPSSLGGRSQSESGARGNSAGGERRHESRFTSGQVGPLAIASSKLYSDDS